MGARILAELAAMLLFAAVAAAGWAVEASWSPAAIFAAFAVLCLTAFDLTGRR